MISCKMSASLAVLAMLIVLVNSSFSSNGGNSYSYDLSNMSDLRKLYNSKVYLADRMKRPLDGTSFILGPLSHSGVRRLSPKRLPMNRTELSGHTPYSPRVTLADGTRWLVHKGNEFGISSQTVVVDARHMSSNWKVVETKNFRGTKTVSDFVRAGGTDYSLIFDNCHFGADRMMDQ
uniref:Uncharacterized protein n=1 Tax=Scleropages formosus TaxID=113540 RepID=A0A8C9WEN9_SCLFO